MDTYEFVTGNTKMHVYDKDDGVCYYCGHNIHNGEEPCTGWQGQGVRVNYHDSYERYLQILHEIVPSLLNVKELGIIKGDL